MGWLWQVLRSVDWTMLSFDVLCVEASPGSAGKNKAVIDLLEEQGFRCVWRSEKRRRLIALIPQVAECGRPSGLERAVGTAHCAQMACATHAERLVRAQGLHTQSPS